MASKPRMNSDVNEEWQENEGRRIRASELMGLDAAGAVTSPSLYASHKFNGKPQATESTPADTECD
ncbi:MAG: hypothetical protein JNL58_02700 [Planctomyces sp.]|nr:hypothetical protein [Planctomyces sp.]